MADPGDKARADAVRDFAAALRELRTAAGTPSFRELSGRSKAISHTTLHEAAQGHRLPSWATTVEFVKACGADPADYRSRWERASRLVRAANADRRVDVEDDAVLAGGECPEPGAASPGNGVPAADAVGAGSVRADNGASDVTALAGSGVLITGAERRRRMSPRYAMLGVGAVVVAGGVVAAIFAANSAGSGDRPAGATGPTKADCPVKQSNPPYAPPAHAGDVAVFIDDITLPDCSKVPESKPVTKIWRFKNAGKVPWHNYSLHRLGGSQSRSQCQTITDVPVPDTRPGDMVDVKVQVTPADHPGFCFVRFKMLDGSGRVAYPGSRPVNFQIVVT